MANNNLQSIKMGKPTSIVGGPSPNAELTVQDMSQCTELTLKDETSRCTNAGAIKTASHILSGADVNGIKIDLQGNANLTAEEIDTFFHLLDQYTSDSNIVGNVTSDIAYQDAVDALHERFPQMNFDVLQWAVRFKDKEVLRVLLEHGVGSDGLISGAQLESLTNISDWFRGNKSITSFNELALSGVRSLAHFAFQDCSNLKEIDVSKLDTCSSYAVFKNANLDGAVLNFSRATRVGDDDAGILVGCTGKGISVFMPSVVNLRGLTNNGNATGTILVEDCGEKLNYLNNRNTYRLDILIVRNTPNSFDTSTLAFGGKYLFCNEDFLTKFTLNTAYAGSRYVGTFRIGSTEWQTVMRSLAEQYAKEYAGWSAEQIASADYSDPYIDYDIFGVPRPE